MTLQSIPYDLRDTPEYREFGFRIVRCPVCGEETLDSHFICRKCGWEYDGTAEETQYSSCNKTTIASYRNQQQ